MATYVTLVRFTPQGIEGIKDSPKRAAKFCKAVKAAGGKVHQMLWTMGRYDGVVVYEAKNDEAATALMLAVGRKGSAHTETLRAFDAKEFSAVLKQLG